MKKYIKAATSDGVILQNDYFALITRSGTYRDKGTTWSGYTVESRGLAKAWVVEIRLERSSLGNDVGGHVKYEYTSSYVAFGIRGDGNRDIDEFIMVLQEAQDFKAKVDEYLKSEGHNIR